MNKSTLSSDPLSKFKTESLDTPMLCHLKRCHQLLGGDLVSLILGLGVSELWEWGDNISLPPRHRQHILVPGVLELWEQSSPSWAGKRSWNETTPMAYLAAGAEPR